MKIQKFNLKKKIFIIAEAGNNHEGNFNRAKKLITLAAKAGADAIKFQTFKTENYINKADIKRFKQLKKFELSYMQFKSLKKLARKKKLKFMSTPLDIKSAEFLIKNAKREEIKTTASGLQYEILKLGMRGVKAEKEYVVTIHYQASFINGEVYDSSIEKEPVSFPLNAPNGTIAGLHEGIELMSIGDQYKFYIPAKLAYGNSSPEGSPIPPGSTLVFVIELTNLATIEGTQL